MGGGGGVGKGVYIAATRPFSMASMIGFARNICTHESRLPRNGNNAHRGSGDAYYGGGARGRESGFINLDEMRARMCVCVCMRSYVVRTSVEKSGEQIQVFPAASGLRAHTPWRSCYFALLATPRDVPKMKYATRGIKKKKKFFFFSFFLYSLEHEYRGDGAEGGE